MAKNGMTENFENRLDSLKDSVRGLGNAASVIKDKVIDVKDTVVSSSKTGVNKLGALIKAHPIAAIGIAFGVGYIVMRIARR